MDPNADSNIAYFDQTERFCTVAELVKVECELAKTMRIIMEQRTQLDQARDKIFQQEVALEEAAKILQQQQELLMFSEKERKAAEGQLQEERLAKKDLRQQYESVRNVFSYTHEQLWGLLEILSNNQIAVDLTNLTKKSGMNEIDTIANILRANMVDRMEQHRRMKDEIIVLKAELAKTQKALQESTTDNQMPLNGISNYMKTKDLEIVDANNNCIEFAEELIKESHAGKLKPRLRRQISKRKDGKWVTCNHCNNDFHGNWALTQHNRKKHAILRRSNSRTFACLQCGFTYKTKEQLQIHRKVCEESTENHKHPGLVEMKLDILNSSDEEDDAMSNGTLLRQTIFLKPHTL